MTALDFIVAICADPGDDAPRLAYADWMEEYATSRKCPFCDGYGVTLGAGPDRGNPKCTDCRGIGFIGDGRAERAEFIRVQCELEPLRPHGHGVNRPHGGDCQVCNRVASLEYRERGLLGAYGADWFRSDMHLAPVAPLERNAWMFREAFKTHRFRLGFERGFLGRFDGTAADFLAHADALLWRPGEKCRGCDGDVPKIVRDAGGEWSCAACRGTGLRPCPETAQPIREVTLTRITRGDIDTLCARRYRLGRGDPLIGRLVQDVFAAEWPQVRAWRLPGGA